MTMVANGGGRRQVVVSNAEKQQSLKAFFEKNKAAIMSVAAKHVTPDRLMRIALSLTSRDAKLLACTPLTLLRSVVECAALGLEPGATLGEAYLVPYNNDATLIVGYKGLIKLARQSGEIKSIRARVVYADDEFQVEYGLKERITHVPVLGSEERRDEDIIAVYAVAELRDGDPQFEVMTRAQVDAIRKRSKSGNSGPWVTDFAEMAKKTVIRRLAKVMPLSAEKSAAYHKALAHENAVEAGERSPVIDVPFLGDDDLQADVTTKDRGDVLASIVTNGSIAHDPETGVIS